MDNVVRLDQPDAQARRIRWNLGRAESHTEQALDAIKRCSALSEDWRSEFRGDVDAIKARLEEIKVML